MSQSSSPASEILSRGVSFLSIVFNGAGWRPDAARERYNSVLTAIRHYGIEEQSELLCVDNSERPDREIEKYLLQATCPPRLDYEWSQGFNLLYGPSINKMVARARYPTIVYFCASHGQFFDNSWLADLVEPLADEYCAMAGSFCHAPMIALPQPMVGFPDVHVQGSLFAAKTNILRDNPYTHKLPHAYSDLWITWRLLTRGYEIADVPTIKAVAEGIVRDSSHFKYIHDYS